jgi:hypothetical protein
LRFDVGSEGFVEQVKNELGFKAENREVLVADGLYAPRESAPSMATISIRKMRPLTPNNTVSWQTSLETIEA